MRKHDVNYHEYDDSISFHFDYCIHLEAFEYSFSNQSTKKKVFFSKRNLSDQSEIIENKEIKIFFEKINNLKMILNRVEFNKKLNESQKRIIERQINESWKKKLRKIETSSSRILKKELKINSFYDEILSKFENESLNEKNIIEIHLIAAASFIILSR